MGCRIRNTDGRIGGTGHNFARLRLDQHRADRNLTAFGCGLGFIQGLLHIVIVCKAAHIPFIGANPRLVNQACPIMPPKPAADNAKPNLDGDRIAKVMARAGVASRRDCEKLIAEGRVKVNGTVLTTPAFKVTRKDTILFDDQPIATKEPPRLWRYHKPEGLVTSHKDEKGRRSVFDNMPKDMPRVISVGRLDIASEGLLLMTNDGAIARALELPKTGFLRRYRARAFGFVTQEKLDTLKKGIKIDGIPTGPIEAMLDKQQGSNVWVTVTIREGKNREVRRALDTLGLTVNRLIRTSYGPFQLGNLPVGQVDEVPNEVLIEQIGHLVTIPKVRPPEKAASGPTRKPKRGSFASAKRFQKDGADAPKSAAKSGPKRGGKPPSKGGPKSAPKGRGKFAKR